MANAIHHERLKLGMLLFVAICGCAGINSDIEHAYTGRLSTKEMAAGLRAWLSPQDFAEYEALTDRQKEEWLRMFWQKHDPTPTTAENEFRTEYFRRVHYALCYFPNSLGPIPWDDRGTVYIKYGQPDERSFVIDGYWDRRKTLSARGARVTGKGLSPAAQEAADISDDAPNLEKELQKPWSREKDMITNPHDRQGEVWYYYGHGLSFQFQDEHGLGCLSLVPYSDPMGSQPRDYMAFAVTKARTVDIQPVAYNYDYGTKRLDYALDMARFRAEDTTFNIDINLGYPLVELARGGSDSTTISLRRIVIIRDDSLREVTSDACILSRRLSPTDNLNQLLVEQKVFNLPSGGYELSVSVEDLFSGRTGILKKTFRLPEFVSREVQEISDIELASVIWSVYEPRTRFIKQGRLVLPLPSHVYMEDQPIAFYFEVYNLAKNSQDLAVYDVEYEILDPGAGRAFHRETTGQLNSTERDVHEFATLEGIDLTPGEYLLSIRVTDETTGHVKRTLTPFKVVSPRN